MGIASRVPDLYPTRDRATNIALIKALLAASDDQAFEVADADAAENFSSVVARGDGLDGDDNAGVGSWREHPALREVRRRAMRQGLFDSAKPLHLGPAVVERLANLLV